MTTSAEPATSGVHVHVHEVDVVWGHCDPAGIVYFPRFFEMFHAAMESWFGRALALPYQDVIVGRKIGFPAVHTEADFKRTTRFGERIAVELSVAKLGTSSLELAYTIVGPDGTVRGTGRTVCVVMELDPTSADFHRARPLPADIRAAIEAFGVAP